MTPTVHLVSVEEAGRGGVGDHTRALAMALEARGVRSRTWHVADASLRQRFPAALIEEPGWVLLQYVPSALGWGGANLGFCLWAGRLRRGGCDLRVLVHEPYFYFGWRRPWRNALAVAQRLMAVIVLRAATVVYVSTVRWVESLAPLAPRNTRFVPLPVPATVATTAPPDRIRGWRDRFRRTGAVSIVGHFGTYGEHVAGDLEPIVSALLRSRREAAVALIGRNSDRFAAAVAERHPDLAGRLVATGALDGEDAAAALRACDIAIQPYPDGVTTRRTSMMAPLANGVATVSSRGRLTEPLWLESAAAALAAAGNAAEHAAEIQRLLDDPEARRTLAERGRATYEAHFSIARAMEVLLSPVTAG